MKVVKKTAEYRISRRRDGRYAVQGVDRNPINGDDKVRILLAEGLVEAPAPKAAAEEAPADADTEGSPEAASADDA
jgi:hypothetical protein